MLHKAKNAYPDPGEPTKKKTVKLFVIKDALAGGLKFTFKA
jgi:hypothetical protein